VRSHVFGILVIDSLVNEIVLIQNDFMLFDSGNFLVDLSQLGLLDSLILGQIFEDLLPLSEILLMDGGFQILSLSLRVSLFWAWMRNDCWRGSLSDWALHFHWTLGHRRGHCAPPADGA